MNIPVVYEDDWLVIVDKPSGLLVVPTPKKEPRTLTSILNEDLREKALTYHIYPAHRLDKETSGLVIYAKGKAVCDKMMDLFRQALVKKKYIAFVHGHPAKEEGEITNRLEGKYACTRYRVICSKKDFTEVEVRPQTGRTNQIRLHFKYLGHPLVGETRFAFRKDFALKAKRLCLHALSLDFPHPVTQKTVRVTSELPKDLEDFLKTH